MSKKNRNLKNVIATTLLTLGMVGSVFNVLFPISSYASFSPTSPSYSASTISGEELADDLNNPGYGGTGPNSMQFPSYSPESLATNGDMNSTFDDDTGNSMPNMDSTMSMNTQEFGD
ncbi:MAG: hypothetical protein HQK53_03725 [Oligoflexia bacterium]|nr:hypothetical protein [Oligoflexia bacterium]